MSSVLYPFQGNKVKIGTFVLTAFFLILPLQECQEFFRLLAVCHTVMVESNNGMNYRFFWSRESYRVFSHDVTAAILVSQNNETAAMLVSQTNPLGVVLFSYANAFLCFNKFV